MNAVVSFSKFQFQSDVQNRTPINHYRTEI